MNHLARFDKLKNRYFVMRHGQSLANVQGIILSNPGRAISEFGLSPNGQEQVKSSIFKQKNLGSKTIIYCSDFKRARETAEIARKTLKASPSIQLSSKLRERHFGKWEQTSDTNYLKAWAHDNNPSATNHDIESLNHLINRVTLLIAQLEKKYSGKTILLVTHGDPMKMLMLCFQMKNPSKHARMKVQVAQINKLKFKPKKQEKTIKEKYEKKEIKKFA